MVHISTRIFLISSLALFSWLAQPSGRAYALNEAVQDATLPRLDAFVEQVRNGEADTLRGIYIPDILAAPVVQQPAGLEDFVSPWQNIVTQFSLASRSGSTGLIAHNYLAGERFARLHTGQEIHLVHGDGQVTTYIVSEILQYQALDPDSTFSAFLDLESEAVLRHSELFRKVYDRPGQVIFQTCIQQGNNLTWGRLFVIAGPVPR